MKISISKMLPEDCVHPWRGRPRFLVGGRSGAPHVGDIESTLAVDADVIRTELQEHFHGPSRQISPGHALRVAEVEGPSVNDSDATTATVRAHYVGRLLNDAAATRAEAKRKSRVTTVISCDV